MLMGMLKGTLSGTLTLEETLEGILIKLQMLRETQGELGKQEMMLIKSLSLGESLTLREMLEVSELLEGTPACSEMLTRLPTTSWLVDDTAWVLGEAVRMKSPQMEKGALTCTFLLTSSWPLDFKKVWPASSTRSHRAMQMLNATTWYLDLLSLPAHGAGWSPGAFGPISEGTVDAEPSTVGAGAWWSLYDLAFSCSGW